MRFPSLDNAVYNYYILPLPLSLTDEYSLKPPSPVSHLSLLSCASITPHYLSVASLPILTSTFFQTTSSSDPPLPFSAADIRYLSTHPHHGLSYTATSVLFKNPVCPPPPRRTSYIPACLSPLYLCNPRIYAYLSSPSLYLVVLHL